MHVDAPLWEIHDVQERLLSWIVICSQQKCTGCPSKRLSVVYMQLRLNPSTSTRPMTPYQGEGQCLLTAKPRYSVTSSL